MWDLAGQKLEYDKQIWFSIQLSSDIKNKNGFIDTYFYTDAILKRWIICLDLKQEFKDELLFLFIFLSNAGVKCFHMCLRATQKMYAAVIASLNFYIRSIVWNYTKTCKNTNCG